MAELNTTKDSSHNSESNTVKSTHETQEEQIDQLRELMSKIGVIGTFIFKFPEDEDSFRFIQVGHFYDTLRLISAYCKRAKDRIMSDLDGLA